MVKSFLGSLRSLAHSRARAPLATRRAGEARHVTGVALPEQADCPVRGGLDIPHEPAFRPVNLARQILPMRRELTGVRCTDCAGRIHLVAERVSA